MAGLAKLLHLKISAKVILTINTDIQDHLMVKPRMPFILALLKIPLERYMLSFLIKKLV